MGLRVCCGLCGFCVGPKAALDPALWPNLIIIKAKLDNLNFLIYKINVQPILLKCPSCTNNLAVRRLECPSCGLSLESTFELPAILRLNRPQLDFVEVFIKNRGVIRDVERELGISYPTVRAKLDEVVAAMGFQGREAAEGPQVEQDSSRRTVLTELREGRISPEDALRALRRRTPKAGSDAGG
jgi:hypothetical protein